MFSMLSMTGSGMVVALLTVILAHFHIVLSDSQASLLVKDVLEVAGIVMAVIGQVRRPDLHYGLVRRKRR